MHRLHRAVFLDRDGVINEDLGYVSRMEDFRLIEGALEGMLRLQALGLQLIIVTNQSGIARGYYTEHDYQQLTRAYLKQLSECGVEVTAVLHCPHAPDGDCDCRKPKPGMLMTAAERSQLDLAGSYLVGDKLSDVQAGMAAGVRSCVLVGNAASSLPAAACRARDLLGAAQHIATMESR